MSKERFELYSSAVSTASHRSRATLFIMVTASIVIFSAFWNARPYAWTTKRIAVMKAARLCYGEPEKPGWMDQGLYDQAQDYLAKSRMPREGMTEGQKIRRLEFLDKAIEGLESARIQNFLLVSVPFFGVTFDVNDLGILGGLALAVTLLLFRYSLAAELTTLRLAFDEGWRGEEKRTAYNLLFMSQVFTRPPGMAGDLAIWRWIPYILYCLPVIVMFLITLQDGYTFPLGSAYSYRNALVSVISSAVFLVICALLTASCVLSGNALRKEWKLRYQGLAK